MLQETFIHSKQRTPTIWFWLRRFTNWSLFHRFLCRMEIGVKYPMQPKILNCLILHMWNWIIWPIIVQIWLFKCSCKQLGFYLRSAVHLTRVVKLVTWLLFIVSLRRVTDWQARASLRLDSAWFQLSWEERINRVIHLAKEKQSYTNQCFNPTKLFMSKNNKPFYCNSYSFSLLYLGTKSILYFCCKLQILWRKPWSQSHKDIS